MADHDLVAVKMRQESSKLEIFLCRCHDQLAEDIFIWIFRLSGHLGLVCIARSKADCQWSVKRFEFSILLSNFKGMIAYGDFFTTAGN